MLTIFFLFQVRQKYLIIPDKTNNFQVQGPADAMLTEQVKIMNIDLTYK